MLIDTPVAESNLPSLQCFFIELRPVDAAFKYLDPCNRDSQLQTCQGPQMRSKGAISPLLSRCKQS